VALGDLDSALAFKVLFISETPSYELESTLLCYMTSQTAGRYFTDIISLLILTSIVNQKSDLQPSVDVNSINDPNSATIICAMPSPVPASFVVIAC
jgi:hypothetical protein